MRKQSSTLRLRLLPVLLSVTTMTGCAGLGETTQAKEAGQAPVLDNSAVAAGMPTATPSARIDESKEKPEMARISKGTGVLVNPPSAVPTRTEGGNISLNFEGADIRDIAKTVLAEILKESYIVDPKVSGTISFRTTNPLPRNALLPTLETILRMNGFVMIKENGIFKIMPSASARGSLSPRMGGSLAGYTIQVVPLQFVSAIEMIKLLEPFAADPTAIKADELRNLLILSGTQNEIQHMLDTISVFDADWLSGMSIGLFALQNADVKSVSSEINKILGDKTLNPLAGLVRIIPIERLNAFVIISPQAHYLDQAKLWIERLDTTGGTGGTRLHVYHVQNGKAEYLADLLNQTFASKNQAPATTTRAPTVAPGLTSTQIGSSSLFGSTSNTNSALGSTTTGNTAQRATAPAVGATLSITDDSGSASEVRVVADRENNALLILSSAAGYEKIESALKKLDVAPRQVLIEVTIAEVTLTDDLSYGVEWAISSGSRKSFQLDTNKDVSGIAALVPGFSYALSNVAGDAIKAVFNTLATDGKVNVLSSPHIMVADNQTAKIQVGNSVPIQTSSTAALATTTTGTVTSTIQYLDTGVMLSVTPHINAGGLVNLDINQEVSNAIENKVSGLDSPTITKRAAKTIVTVQSGETMVLGGLISENNNVGSSGIPFLSEIPILGAVFGSKTRNATKTELILLITPRVANNVTQGKDISDELRRKMGETKDLIDCGTSNILGYTTRGGPWCMQARRYDGAIDKMRLEDENGIPVYLKDEAKLEQAEAQRVLDEANRKQEAAKQRLDAASKRVKETQGVPKKAAPAAVKPKQAAQPSNTEATTPPGATPAPQPVEADKPAQPPQ